MKKIIYTMIYLMSSLLLINNVKALDNTLEVSCGTPDSNQNNLITCTIKGSVTSGNISNFGMKYSASDVVLKDCIGENGVSLTCTSNEISGSFNNPNINNGNLGTISFIANIPGQKNIVFSDKHISERKPSTNNSNWTFIGDSYFAMLNVKNNNFNNGIGTPDLMNVTLYGVPGTKIETVYSELIQADSPIVIDGNTTDVVVYLGTNNIWQNYSASDTAGYMRELIEAIHTRNPNVHIHLLKLFVTHFSDQENLIMYDEMKKVNNYYQQLANEYSYVTFVDTHAGLIDDSGVLMNPYHGHVPVANHPIWVSNLINTFHLDYDVNSYSLNTNDTIQIRIKSNDSTLKNISINGKNIPGTNTQINESVPFNINKVTIGAVLSDENASYVKGFGPREVILKEGTNEIVLKVISEDLKSTTVYIINITKQKNILASNASIASIKVNGKELIFDSQQQAYTLKVKNDVLTANIESILVNKKAHFLEEYKPRIVNLKEGINRIVLKVVSEDNSTTREYIINIEREEKNSSTTEDKNEEDDSVENPSTDEDKDKEDNVVENPSTGLSKSIIFVSVGIIFIGFIVLLVWKNKKYFSKSLHK